MQVEGAPGEVPSFQQQSSRPEPDEGCEASVRTTRAAKIQVDEQTPASQEENLHKEAVLRTFINLIPTKKTRMFFPGSKASYKVHMRETKNAKTGKPLED